jgi:hypothetical protein
MTPHELESFQGAAQDAGVVFFFSGEFTPSGVEALGLALRRRLEELEVPGKPSRRIFSAFVEMAQNVLHYAVCAAHASPSGDVAGADGGGRRGTIAIGDGGDHHWIACSNEVGADQVPRIAERLAAIAHMSPAQLREAYVRQLQNEVHEQEDPLSQGAGLGLLTIARAARAPLEHAFVPVQGSGGALQRFVLCARLDGAPPVEAR